MADQCVTRRDFVRSSAAAAVVAAGCSADGSAAPAEEPKLPQIRLGPHSISRLVCGANPFYAGSHLSVFVNHAMRSYYMTCVYERHRSAEALEKLLGQAPIPVGEVYLPQDPPRMFRAIRQTKRPCLAFKILAAGRGDYRSFRFNSDACSAANCRSSSAKSSRRSHCST